MALREELDNYNAEIVVGPEDDPQVTNAQLAVEEWNRTTVADGAWLQQNAIGPLSARDIVLANAIDDTNDALAELSGKMADVDGRSLKSINGRFFSGGAEIWQGSDPAIVPDGTGVKNDEAIYVPVSDGVILSLNDNAGHAHQLKIKENEIGYRYLAGASTAEGQGTIPGTKYKYDTQASDFKSVILAPVGSGNYLVNSAGGFHELKFDQYAFTENENGEVAIKNLGNWKRTTECVVDETADDKETYFHGGPLYLASAAHSTFISDGMSKLAGTVKSTDMNLGGAYAAADTKIEYTRGSLFGTGLSGDAYIEDSDVFFRGSTIYSGGSVKHSLFRGCGGVNVYDKNQYDIVNVHGSTISATSDSIIDGNTYVYSADRALIMGTGVYAYNIKDSIINAEGVTFSSISDSLIVKDGGNVNNVVGSVIVQNGLPIENLTYGLAVGGDNTVKQVSYGGVIGGGNTVENSVTAAFVLGGGNTLKSTVSGGVIFGTNNVMQNSVRNDFVVGHGNTFDGTPVNDFVIGNGNTVKNTARNILAAGDGSLLFDGVKNVIAMGDNIHVSGGVLDGIAIGDNVKMKGDYSYVAGDDNNAWKNGALIIGPNNEQGEAYTLMLGTELTGWGEHSVLIGEHNKVCRPYSMTLGNDLQAGLSHNMLIGDHLKSTNDYQVIIGQYAVCVSDSVLEIGLGTSTIAKTIFRVDREGNVWMAGDLHCMNVSANSVTQGITPPNMSGPAWTDI